MMATMTEQEPVVGLIDEVMHDRPAVVRPPLEVGVVYSRPGSDRLWIATGEYSVATVVGEPPAQSWHVAPTVRRGEYRTRPAVSTIDLCLAWDIEVDELDAFMSIALRAGR